MTGLITYPPTVAPDVLADWQHYETRNQAANLAYDQAHARPCCRHCGRSSRTGSGNASHERQCKWRLTVVSP